jgi:hypothetical protein
MTLNTHQVLKKPPRNCFMDNPPINRPRTGERVDEIKQQGVAPKNVNYVKNVKARPLFPMLYHLSQIVQCDK